MIKQRTLNNVIKATGVGVHTGEKVYLTLHPAPVDKGIVFRRVDLNPVVEIAARVENVGDTTLSSTIVNGDIRISTVEHLMSAMAGLGIDNAYVDVTSSEVPVMDGSSGPFVFLLQSAGLCEQNAPKRFIRIKNKVTIKDNDKWATLEPYEGFKVGFAINYDHPAFKSRNQHAVFDFSTTSYIKEISRARTFGFMSEYEYLLANDLAKGSNLDNTVVLDDFRILNEDGLRYDDEFVKHKILDAIGDLYLLGSPIIGAFDGYKAGHNLNYRLVKALLADKKAWEFVTFPEEDAQTPITFGEPAGVMVV